MTSETATPGVYQPDLHAYDFENDPVPTLNRLRAEDPVHWSRHGFWFLTRYEHVSIILKDAGRFSSAAAGWGESSPLARKEEVVGQSQSERNLSRSLANSFNQIDPPDHTRIRALVQAAFSRRAIEERKGPDRRSYQCVSITARYKGSSVLLYPKLLNPGGTGRQEPLHSGQSASVLPTRSRKFLPDIVAADIPSLITKWRGSSWVCSALDWDRKVSDSPVRGFASAV